MMKRGSKVVFGLALFALVVLTIWVDFGGSAANKKKLVGAWNSRRLPTNAAN